MVTLRELDSVRGLTDTLRARQHEFANRMHTLAGLLELGEPNEALRYLLIIFPMRGGTGRDSLIQAAPPCGTRCARRTP